MSEAQNVKKCARCFNDSVENGICTVCGHAVNEKNKTALRDFSVLKNRYQIGKVLGVGGFGITYLAKDMTTGLLCAVKEYLPSEIAMRETYDQSVMVASAGNATVYEHGLVRFFDEATLLSKLSGCKEIVSVFDCFKQNNTAYLVMEYLEGVTLRRLVSNSMGSLSYDKAYRILKDIASALKKVHAGGVLHRDISPENIFITTSGHTKLIDFGAARYYVSERSQNLSIVLKPGFAPPEQYSSKGNQGPWTDIYALACSFYYSLSGVGVPPAIDRLNGAPVRLLHTINKSIPKYISLAINKAMDLNLKNRQQNVSELLDDLNEDGDKEEDVNSGAVETIDTKARTSIFRKIIDYLLGREPGLVLSSEVPRIEAISGPLKGASWALDSNAPVQMGRSASNCEIALTTGSDISRIHCILWYDGASKCFFLQDCSRNGTFSGSGKAFENGVRYPLNPGDTFYLATRDYMFRVVLR